MSAAPRGQRLQLIFRKRRRAVAASSLHAILTFV
jgi:hypothetical protein